MTAARWAYIAMADYQGSPDAYAIGKVYEGIPGATLCPDQPRFVNKANAITHAENLNDDRHITRREVMDIVTSCTRQG